MHEPICGLEWVQRRTSIWKSFSGRNSLRQYIQLQKVTNLRVINPAQLAQSPFQRGGIQKCHRFPSHKPRTPARRISRFLLIACEMAGFARTKQEQNKREGGAAGEGGVAKGDLSLWNGRLKTSNAQPEALLRKQKDHRHNVTVDGGGCQISSSYRGGLWIAQGNGGPVGENISSRIILHICIHFVFIYFFSLLSLTYKAS